MPSLDTYQQRVLRGEPLTDTLVIDCHCHMDLWFNFSIPDSTPADMVRWMDRAGIDACVSSHHLAIGPDCTEGNRLVFQAAEEFPGRIYGYVGVNANHPTADSIAELGKYVSHPGMKGVKLHPDFQQYPANGERYEPIWEWANERGCVVLSHTWKGSPFSDPGLFRDLAGKYANTRIIMGHSGGTTFEGADQCIELAKEHPHVFLDLTGSLMYEGLIEHMVEQLGAERILFGTDLPFLDVRPQLGRVAFAGISPEAKARIYGLNAGELYGIGGRGDC